MMDQLKNYYKEMGVDEKVFDYAQEVEKGLKDRFETLDAIAQLNQIKVLNAMQKHQIAEMHLGAQQDMDTMILEEKLWKHCMRMFLEQKMHL